jgi:hypothetical protein
MTEKLTAREKMFGVSQESFLWCLHCERAYPKDQIRIDPSWGLEMCHYKDCDGDAVLDAWAWSKFRDGRAAYPEQPEMGVNYPLYD